MTIFDKKAEKTLSAHIHDESEWNNCFIIHAEALDKKQHALN